MSAQTGPATSIILTEDFFGVVANQLFHAMAEGTKPERKDAFLTIRQMAKTAKLITSKEKVLSIGVGCNISGQKHISIVLEASPRSVEEFAQSKVTFAAMIAREILHKGLKDSTWSSNNPNAFAELLKYEQDMAKQIEGLV